MTIQWMLVAAFLYLELGFIFLLMMPFISPKVWKYVFYSRFFRMVASRANVYFVVFIIVLIFFFIDSVREMVKYSDKSSVDLGQELQVHLKLFRSQRNYYISGFTVFLCIVIRRLVMLVVCEADLLSENESAMKRAQNATETVEKILKKKEEIEIENSIINQASVIEANKLRKEVENAKNELDNVRRSLEELKQKSNAVTKEYEVLLEKHTALLNKAIEDEKRKSESKKHTEDVENIDTNEEISQSEDDVSNSKSE